jgi:uncharacterized protein (TIGR03437 family)
VTVSQGSSTRTFLATAGSITKDQKATVQAAWNGRSRSTNIYLRRTQSSAAASAIEVRNAADFASGAVCSPGSWASVVGENLTSHASLRSETIPLPTSLGGIQVKVNGTSAPLLFVSDSRITFQCPAFAENSTIQVTVESESGVVDGVEDVLYEASPALFTLDTLGPTQGAVVISETNELAMHRAGEVSSRAAKKGEYISIYANGLGLTEENILIGAPAPLDRLLRVKNRVLVSIGDMTVEPAFVGLAPGSIGLYQINVAIPEGVPAGESIPVQIEVTLSDGSKAISNTVTIAVDESVATN